MYPVRLILGGQGESFSQVDVATVTIPVTITRNGNEPSYDSEEGVTDRSSKIKFVIPVEVGDTRCTVADPVDIKVDYSRDVYTEVDIFLTPAYESPTVSEFLNKRSSPGGS